MQTAVEGPLTGKTALVTGASQGIGRACAMALSAQGACVILAARNLDKLQQVADEIASSGGTALIQEIDVSQEESIKVAARAVLARRGIVDILVNNAGVTRDGLMLRMRRADWDETLTTNLTGVFLLTQALLSPMLKARWGRIINIASVTGQTGKAGQVNYGASKAGLVGFTRSLAREIGSRNVTVNAVSPGFIETSMTSVLDEKQKTSLLINVPLNRPGTDEEVAHAVCFLAHPLAGYITGHTLDVNGGMHMGG